MIHHMTNFLIWILKTIIETVKIQSIQLQLPPGLIETVKKRCLTAELVLKKLKDKLLL